jgi:peptide/nickel transport system substrate-binding protein
MEGSSITERLRGHRFEVFIRGISGSPAEYDFKSILHSESASIDGGNYTGFGTAESDSLIDAINVTTDLQQKTTYLKRFQEILYDESTILFLYVTKNRIAVSKRIDTIKMLTNKQGYDAGTFVLK